MHLNLGSPTRISDQNSVETPVKRSKVDFISSLNTAETPTGDLSDNKSTIADVDAEELFKNFSRIVTVSECDDELPESEVYRKLQYDSELSKLDFDQSGSSMRKKFRGSRLLPEQQNYCIRVRPFQLSGSDQQDENSKENQKKIVTPQKDSKKLTKQNRGMTTPMKMKMKPKDLQLAAKKEDPFRDLQVQKRC